MSETKGALTAPDRHKAVEEDTELGRDLLVERRVPARCKPGSATSTGGEQDATSAQDGWRHEP